MNNVINAHSNDQVHHSQSKYAVQARIYYLALALFGILGEVIRQSIIVNGDATSTVNNIKGSEFLFRISFVSELVSYVCFLLLGHAFYNLFKLINKRNASLLKLFVSASVPLYMANLVNQIGIILILTDSEYSSYFSSFSENQIEALIMFFLAIHDLSYTIAALFFGLWLIPLGLLIRESKYCPVFFGYALIASGISMILNTILFFLFPSFHTIIEPGLVIFSIGEMLFIIWFVVKGVKLH